MTHRAVGLPLGALFVVGLVLGCGRKAEPRYVMPDLPPIDPATIKIGAAGGPPGKPEAGADKAPGRAKALPKKTPEAPPTKSPTGTP